MLKVSYGVVGNRGLAVLDMDEGDLRILEVIPSPFFGTKGVGLDIQGIVQNGKWVKECSEEQFEVLAETIEEFNATYFSEDDVEELQKIITTLENEIDALREEIDELSGENNRLLEKINKFKTLYTELD